MDIKTIKEKLRKANQLLDKYKVLEAIAVFKEIALETGAYKLSDKIESLRHTYTYMAQYMMRGVPDNSRHDVYDDIVSSLRLIGESMLFRAEIDEKSDCYSSTCRTIRLRKLSMAGLIDALRRNQSEISLGEEANGDISALYRSKDDLLRDLFDFVWTFRDSKKDLEALKEYSLDPSTPRSDIFIIISALTLSILGYYDRDKLTLLLDIYENTDSEAIAARSLTGAVFALRRHAEWVRRDRTLMQRLRVWDGSIVTFRRLREVVKNIIRTRDTDRVTSKMRDEVIPELMKMKPEILKKLKNPDADLETGLMDQNMEWQEMLDKSGISKKMHELSEMQGEGADLMMVTFSNLKNFPFFYVAGNWFRPFDRNNPALSLESKTLDTMMQLFSTGNAICDSDKYSLGLAFATMPDKQRDMVLGQFDAQMSQITEEMKDQLLKQSMPEFDNNSLTFIRDLYRFFKLFYKRHEFDDPFSAPFDFIGIPVVGDILSDREIIMVTAEFYFKRGYYEEALHLFNLIEENYGSDASYWEKIGYCHQVLKDFQLALDAYRKAELLKNPGTWLIKKLAVINKRLGNFAEAARYYNMALDSDPDNVSLILGAGDMKYEAGDYPAALAEYYHADYLVPDNLRIMRSIAWTEMMNRQYDKSQKMYDKIMNASPDASDYLNAGHLHLLEDEIAKAIDLYKMSAVNNPAQFEADFIADIPTLKKLGVDTLDLYLMLDILKEDLSLTNGSR